MILMTIFAFFRSQNNIKTNSSQYNHSQVGHFEFFKMATAEKIKSHVLASMGDRIMILVSIFTFFISQNNIRTISNPYKHHKYVKMATIGIKKVLSQFLYDLE